MDKDMKNEVMKRETTACRNLIRAAIAIFARLVLLQHIKKLHFLFWYAVL